MSKDETPVAESVEVTQADREAAASIIVLTEYQKAVIAGRCDDAPSVVAFARHRLAAYEAGRAEGVRAAAEGSWNIIQRFLRTIEASPFWEDRTVVCVWEALEPIRAISKDAAK